MSLSRLQRGKKPASLLGVIWALFAFASFSVGQAGSGTSTTSGPCSPAISGNNNRVTISCSGITKQDAAKFSALLNEILRRQMDSQKLLDALGEINAKIPRTRGILIPAADPDPAPWCGATDGGLKLVMGLTAFANPVSDKVLAIGKHDWIAIHRLGEGIAVDADMSSDDGKLMLRIRNNQFAVNPNNTFNVEGDDSTLIVHDSYGTEVLNVRLANKNTVRMTGKFNPAPGVHVEITEREIKTVGTRLNFDSLGTCFDHCGTLQIDVLGQDH